VSDSPKIIWYDDQECSAGPVKFGDSEVKYVRADLVDGLVKALNLTMPTLERLMFEAKGSYGKNFTPRCETDIKNYEVVRAALKALESAEIGRGME
jgi:hypothetical protein